MLRRWTNDLLKYYNPQNVDDRKREELKLEYKFLTCSMFVHNEDFSPIPQVQLKNPLRQQRAFKLDDFQEALDYAFPGDLIFVKANNLTVDFTITKPLWLSFSGTAIGGNVVLDFEGGCSNWLMHLDECAENAIQPIILQSAFFTDGTSLTIKNAEVILTDVSFYPKLTLSPESRVTLVSCDLAHLDFEDFTALYCYHTTFWDITTVSEYLSTIIPQVQTGSLSNSKLSSLLSLMGPYAEVTNDRTPGFFVSKALFLVHIYRLNTKNFEVTYNFLSTLCYVAERWPEETIKSVDISYTLQTVSENFPDNPVLAELSAEILLWVVKKELFDALGASIYRVIINLLNRHVENENVTTLLLLAFWEISFAFTSIAASVVLEDLSLFERLYERWSDDLKLVDSIYGCTINVLISSRSVERKGIADKILPHLVKYWHLSDPTCAFRVLTGVLKSCSDPAWQFFFKSQMLEQKIIPMLMGEWEEEAKKRLWDLILAIAEHKDGSIRLSKYVSNFDKTLGEAQKAKVAMMISQHPKIDSMLIKAAASLAGTNHTSMFRDLMQVVVNVSRNSVEGCKEELTKLYSTLLSRSHFFSTSREVSRWISWMSNAFNHTEHVMLEDRVCMDPKKSDGFEMTVDGLTLRHGTKFSFSSAVCTHSVKTGKWYYEVTIHSSHLFQIGWANSIFEASPQAGRGVGDDKNSWSIDFWRMSAWHEQENGNVEKAITTQGVPQWKEGDVVRLFVDCEAKTLAFALNDKHIGVYFQDIKVLDGLYPAISSTLDHECTFNFGETQFRYPPIYENEEYQPFVRVLQTKN
eukprot:TRINITY_DN5178_c0_g1_i1.p1 TRINITY_DN5178_c0_g1~~TRINITY_DN5178_c0_g1_i1.p1  ORF type:complete len:806 (+),score=116.23 TRINITY_DN5178_c0_g1_i1:370-2787(+)